jgi:hypothetical protein
MASGKRPDKNRKRATGKKVRRLARAIVGAVPASRVVQPKTLRKKPKHKKPPDIEEVGE